MTIFEVKNIYVMITSIIVLYVGIGLQRQFPIFKKYNIPAPVVGGLLCSCLIAFLYVRYGVEIRFSTTLRDIFLLTFFSTIGLSARFRLLFEGGKAMLILVGLVIAVLCVQNLIGVASAFLFGVHPSYGLLGGSLSFAGGHGTSLAYAELFTEKFGLKAALEVGMACATFGLILGGLIGGPIARRLIIRHTLSGDTKIASMTPSTDDAAKKGPVSMNSMIDGIFLVSVCMAVGAIIEKWCGGHDFTVPGFLTAMFTGVVLGNVWDPKSKRDINTIGLISDVSLQLFLAMSLMSLQLWTLWSHGIMWKLTCVFSLQMLLMALFAYYIVFRVMGKDYDASVMTAGFVGFGLGATPVAIANMRAITGQYGASPKSFLIIPLIGAFFLDIINAAMIQVYLMLPIFSQ